jgi:hypothetical protein
VESQGLTLAVNG